MTPRGQDSSCPIENRPKLWAQPERIYENTLRGHLGVIQSLDKYYDVRLDNRERSNSSSWIPTRRNGAQWSPRGNIPDQEDHHLTADAKTERKFDKYHEFEVQGFSSVLFSSEDSVKNQNSTLCQKINTSGRTSNWTNRSQLWLHCRCAI